MNELSPIAPLLGATYRFGPIVEPDATTFRLWAPSQPRLELLLQDREPLPMEKDTDGFHALRVAGVGPGARYKFRIPAADFPDPASRRQDGDTTGWSVVHLPIPPERHPNPLRPWHETIIAEVHVGTVTPEGTFAALTGRLEHFRDAGYTAIELMPVNTFPGDRNWGYDGTLIFAPDESYGSPEDLHALIARAHDLGLCMILDVVYNHFGEVDDFIKLYCPEWHASEIETPWGPGVDYRQPMVRQFYYENARMWLEDYNFDGLRFDAVHEMHTDARDLFLGDLAKTCRAVKPDAKLVTENAKNLAHWLKRGDDEMPVDYTAQWNEDIHHVLIAMATGDKAKYGYDDPDKDMVADLEKGLADGFVHDSETGEPSDGRIRGEPGSQLPPEAFVSYVQNHDQIGNRADSKRLPERVDARRLDFLHFVPMLAPQIPLFFMGEEAHLRSKFHFFVDLRGEANEAKKKERFEQLTGMFRDAVTWEEMPDPSDPALFQSSKLPWDDFRRDEHRAALDRFCELVAYRRDLVWPLTATRCADATSKRENGVIVVTWKFEAGDLSMALNPSNQHVEAGCEIPGTGVVATGNFHCENGRLTLEPWSAVVWKSDRE
jgi:maltooligosyltrehalose trehalohydrolase